MMRLLSEEQVADQLTVSLCRRAIVMVLLCSSRVNHGCFTCQFPQEG